jgi:hypothetical protein
LINATLHLGADDDFVGGDDAGEHDRCGLARKFKIDPRGEQHDERNNDESDFFHGQDRTGTLKQEDGQLKIEN